MNDRKKLGSVLRRHREQLELSLRALGKRTGIPWATLHSLEIGRGRLDTVQLASLQGVFGENLSSELVRLATPKKEKKAKYERRA